jgi:hypothetical protein
VTYAGALGVYAPALTLIYAPPSLLLGSLFLVWFFLRIFISCGPLESRDYSFLRLLGRRDGQTESETSSPRRGDKLKLQFSAVVAALIALSIGAATVRRKWPGRRPRRAVASRTTARRPSARRRGTTLASRAARTGPQGRWHSGAGTRSAEGPRGSARSSALCARSTTGRVPSTASSAR